MATCLLEDAARGHAIVAFWSSDQLSIALLAVQRFGLRPALERFEIVADDSLGGELMCALGARLGLTMRSIHTSGNPRRLEDVGAWMRKPAPFFMAVDGGTVYGTVPTGIVRLAARLRSRIWPVAVRTRPAFRIPGLIASMPVPHASVALAVGIPMVVERTAPVAVAATDLKNRLNRARDLADSVLFSREVPDRATGKGNVIDPWRRTV